MAGGLLAGACASLLLGAVLAGLEPIGLKDGARLPLRVALGLAGAAVALGLALRPRVRAAGRRWTLAAAFAATLAIAYGAAAAWPNSGDEYGYFYLARTLLAGRVYNPTPPVPELFDFYWIGVRDGKMASQYLPGWPVVLMPFLALRAAPLANPLLTVALGALLLASLKQVGAGVATRASLLTLVLLAPFTLFNGASYFNHMLAAVAVMGACWLALRDEALPGGWNKAGVGLFLSLALVTRIEAFAITAGLLGIDLLARQRWRALRYVAPAGLGALPLTAAWLAYTALITGSPWLTTQAWAAPQELAFGLGPLATVAAKQAAYVSAFGSFASLAALLLYGAAAWTRLRSGRLRFYDALLPATAVFFVFYPADGGHQYGPRYWFFAWPTVALTIGAAVGEDGFARLGRWRVHLPTLAAVKVAGYVGFALVFSVFLRLYVEARRAVYEVSPPETPAVVLLPERRFRLSPWQGNPYPAFARDFTRNDLDFQAPVLYGRGDLVGSAGLACTLAGRHVYRWEEPGRLRPVPCGEGWVGQ